MKYAAVVLRNVNNPVAKIDFSPVTDAFLSGGVCLEEVLFLSCEDFFGLHRHLVRLTAECDGVFLICDSAFLVSAQNAAAELQTDGEKCMLLVIPAGRAGAERVANEIIPEINRRRNRRFCRVNLGVCGAPGERLREAIAYAEIAAGGKLWLHSGTRNAITKIEIIYDQETPKMIADEVVRILAEELGEYLYNIGDDTLEQRFVDCLKLHRLMVSTAESFTGGGVGRKIVSVPGASAVFYEGINAYNSAAKRERLNVSEVTLQEHGAVSDETAYEMASGLLAAGNCDVAISTTGIAGPDSDESGLPKGLCFIGVGTKKSVKVFRYELTGDRESVTETAINLALFLAYREIK